MFTKYKKILYGIISNFTFYKKRNHENLTVNSYLKAILEEINVHRNLQSALIKRSCKL